MVATGGVQGGERWRLAPCLVALVDETDELYPARTRTADGSIGDPAHQDRVSDHNPDDSGDVLAVDITDDKPAGCDVQRLMDHLVATRDDRVKYLIHQRVVVNCNDWKPRRYTGDNPHTYHLHISVRDTAKQDTSQWWPPQPSHQPQEPDPMLTFESPGKPVFLLSGGKAAGFKTATDLAAVRAAWQAATGQPLAHVKLEAGTYGEWIARFRDA